jgi:hypothetical protein
MPSQRGQTVDDQLKRLVKELGEAINQAVADSDRISDVMARIRAGGNDIFLVLEATIGFTRPDPPGEGPGPQKSSTPSGELLITSQDAQFLRSLRISVNDET